MAISYIDTRNVEPWENSHATSQTP